MLVRQGANTSVDHRQCTTGKSCISWKADSSTQVKGSVNTVNLAEMASCFLRTACQTDPCVFSLLLTLKAQSFIVFLSFYPFVFPCVCSRHCLSPHLVYINSCSLFEFLSHFIFIAIFKLSNCECNLLLYERDYQTKFHCILCNGNKASSSFFVYLKKVLPSSISTSGTGYWSVGQWFERLEEVSLRKYVALSMHVCAHVITCVCHLCAR